MPDVPRFGFPPLERRGVLLGLSLPQLATIASGILGALIARSSVGGSIGSAVAVLTVALALAAALCHRHGRPLAAWAPVVAGWALRGGGAVRVSDAPLSGHPGTGRGSNRPVRLADGGRPIGGVRILSDPAKAGRPEMAVVVGKAGTRTAVIPVGGRSFALADPLEQVQRLEGWRAVLAALARPGTPVVRVQWVIRSRYGSALRPTAETAAVDQRQPPIGGSELADPRRSYADLMATARKTSGTRQAWLAVAVSAERAVKHKSSYEALRREVNFLRGRLATAGVDAGEALGREALLEIVGAATAVGRVHRSYAGHLRSREPMAVSDRWSTFRADGAWHCTYWVADWPRVEVGPSFLAPLLLVPAEVAVSVVMAPVDPERAMREARSARTADLADSELRTKAGFLPSARRQLEAEGAIRREAELADGQSEFRFSGYVTVSANEPDRLAAAAATVEHAAQGARLELRRLYGRQAEAFTWTLPLGEGLR